MKGKVVSSLISQDQTNDKIINRILEFLHEQRGYDFSGNRSSMVQRRITKRISAVQANDLEDYLNYILKNPPELDDLINALTINVSNFFRNSIVFEHLANRLSDILLEKRRAGDNTIRIWSAGCATGEEPYSIAIIMNELIQNESVKPDVYIFATDIDREALRKGKEGIYSIEDVSNVKLKLVNKYFSVGKNTYTINKQIKDMVSFSHFDLLHKRSSSPAESIFGDFDIILCRNVLIYFNFDFQEIILHKLYRSLSNGGYLILGEAEMPSANYKSKYYRLTDCCKIYRKK